MRSFYAFKLLIVAATLSFFSVGVSAQITSFGYTGSVQYYTVPAGITSISVDVVAGKGGGSEYGNGGAAGRIQCIMTVTPLTTYSIFVGAVGSGVGNDGGAYGTNGGPYVGGNGSGFGGGGGGSSEIVLGGTRLVVAGGGGGGSWDCTSDHGGLGGSSIGSNGLDCGSYITSSCGTGGNSVTLTGGSAGSSGGTATAGSFGNGGNGGTSGNGWQGGGGAGYYGGGGGSSTGSGGGGSSWPINSSGGITLIASTQGYNNTGNGYVNIQTLCSTPVAGSFTGNTNVCAGATTAITDVGGSTDGVWSSSNPSMATVGSLTGIVTGVRLGTATITYTISHGTCGTITPSLVVTVVAPPSPITTAGSFSACIPTSTTINMSSSPAGGTWSSNNPGIASVVTGTGVVTPNATGLATISYTANGCSSTQTVSVNATPAIYTTGGGGHYCAGSTAPNVTLSNSDYLVNYQLWLNGTTLVSTMAGAGVPLNFGPQSAAGIYTIVAINTNGGCSVNMNSSAIVVVNPLPSTANVVTPSGPTSYCAGGTGVSIGLNGSTSGINYQLMLGTGAYGTAFAGTGSSFTYPFTITTPGVYTVQAQNPVTGCVSAQTGSQTVTVNPLPNIYAVGGGGSYCAGSAGVPVTVSGSDAGVTYSLAGGGSYPSVSGTGSTITFPGVMTSGFSSDYTVTATSSHGCVSTMAGTAFVAVVPLPEADTVTAEAGGAFCAGGTGRHVYLSYSLPGVTYQLYNTSGTVGIPLTGVGGVLDFGAQTIAGNYTVIATNPVSHCTSSMVGSATITVNPLPTPFTMGAGNSYCAGGAGVDVTLTNSSAGNIYQLYNGGTFTGMSYTATTPGPIDFGMQTAGGAYTVVATNEATGCVNTMSGATNVVVNPLPTAYVVTGGGGYCVGTPGVHIMLSSSDMGTSYQLYLGSSMFGMALAGNSGELDFGVDATPGSYTVVATTGTGCTSSMLGSASISINPLPASYSVTGGGAYCAGSTGAPVGLSFSNDGVQYQLMLDGVNVGLPLTGISSALSFGPQTGTGTYTISAMNITTGCTATMSGSQMVSSNPLPFEYSVTGGGGYCIGGTGQPVGLAASNSGISYQLYIGTSPVGGPVTGHGSAINFGIQSTPGNYTVVATNSSTGCVSNMSGVAAIALNSLPNIYSVTDGGSYCAGGAGVPVGLSVSDMGVDYKLYMGSTPVGSPVLGTGSGISFGPQTMAGTYTVKAMNATTSCANNMSGSASVSINAAPAINTVTGGGSICAGSAGLPVGLDGSTSGVNYILSSGGHTLSTMAGTGAALSFGSESSSGSYTVEAVNPSTGCTATMFGAANVIVNALPNAYTVTGGGSYCADSTAPAVSVASSDAGIHYMLYNGGTLVGSYSVGTGSALSFGPEAMAGTYSVVAVNPSTTCSASMTGSVSVSRMAVVNPSVTIAPSANSVCAGVPVTFSATPVNGGGSPMYQWYVDDTLVAGSSATLSYSPDNGDVVSAVLISNAACASGPAASAPVVMNVNPVATISVQTRTTADSVCQGAAAFFYADPVNSGLGAVYSWVKNGALVQAGPSLTYSTVPANGDNVYVIMKSSVNCPSGGIGGTDSIQGSPIAMYVQPRMIPVVSVAVTPGTSVAKGTMVTFTASASNTTVPVYAWSVNGATVATATSSVYSTSELNDGDVVTADVTNMDVCGSNTGSSYKTIHILPEGVQQINAAGATISVLPNPSNGEFLIKGSMGTTENVSLTIEITNIVGQVVYSNKVTAVNGEINAPVRLDNSIANGSYILNIQSAMGSNVYHIVIAK